MLFVELKLGCCFFTTKQPCVVCLLFSCFFENLLRLQLLEQILCHGFEASKKKHVFLFLLVILIFERIILEGLKLYLATRDVFFLKRWTAGGLAM